MYLLLQYLFSRVFLVELGILGWYYVCFDHRNQGLNEVPGKKMSPFRKSLLASMRGSTFFKVQELSMVGLGTEDADWLGSCMKVYLVQNY